MNGITTPFPGVHILFTPFTEGRSAAVVVSSTSGIGEFRHGGRRAMNVCFADGHVEQRTRESIPQDYTDETNGYFWGTAARD